MFYKYEDLYSVLGTHVAKAENRLPKSRVPLWVLWYEHACAQHIYSKQIIVKVVVIKLKIKNSPLERLLGDPCSVLFSEAFRFQLNG